MFDGKAYGEGIVEIVKGYCEREIAPLKAENEDLKARLKALEDRPAPEVLKGDPGEPGKDGNDGAPGRDGSDGRGIKDLLIDRGGQLVATMDDGEMKMLGPVIGKDGSPGQPGKDGRDGFSLDDFDVERGDDGRTLILKFTAGEICHEYEITLQHPVYCGVFQAERQYEVGDCVTWGGNLWHCDKQTTGKPDCGDWTLAVRKGRDGKDAKHG